MSKNLSPAPNCNVAIRKNVQAVYESWLDNEPEKFESISTDGKTIFSYATPILFVKNRKLILNLKKYSTTTTKQQTQLHYFLEAEGRKFVTL